MFWKKKLKNIEPSQAVLQEAKNNPNGWVYVINGNYEANEEVPPHAIAGAWKVDDSGNIVKDSYQANPNFKK